MANAIDRLDIDLRGAEVEDERRSTEVAALWAALSADHRARDERTARLRAMRLIAGEDEGGPA